jgi:hypothetical protein
MTTAIDGATTKLRGTNGAIDQTYATMHVRMAIVNGTPGIVSQLPGRHIVSV